MGYRSCTLSLIGLVSDLICSFSQAIAWSVYSFGTTAKFDAKIATLAANGLGWLYCSVVAIRVAFIGASVMLGTSRQASKIALPDQHIYKMHGADDKGYVLMENEGVHGTFNRSVSWLV